MRTLILPLVLSFATVARAETVQLIGWAKDGKYVALAMVGTGEGSGYPFAKLTIYDAKKGKAVGESTTVTLENEGATENDALEQAKEKATKLGQKLGVKEWVEGKSIAHDDKGELKGSDGAPIGTVEVKTKKAKKGAKPCDEPFQPLLVQMLLHSMGGDKPTKLLDEKKVPKERACVTECSLGSVYAFQKAAVFVLSCGVQGFEGPGTTFYPVVVGKLAYGLDEDLPASP